MHCQVGRLLHRLDGEILDRLYNDGTLTADPRDHRRPIFIVMAPAGLAFLAATTWSASQRLLPALLRLALVTGGVIQFIGFDRAFQLAMPLVGHGRMAQPPAPTVARADMHAQLSRDTMR